MTDITPNEPKNSRTEEWVRLGLGTALNFFLWNAVNIWTGTSNIDREFRNAMLGGVIGALTLVCVVPLFWRGRPWQAPLAFVLMWLPSVTLFMAIRFAVKHL